MTKKEFYEKNDKVFTTYPVVKNTVSKDLIDSIPESVAERRDFLKKHLNNLDGKTIYCPSLEAKSFNDVSSVFSDASTTGIKNAAALWDHQPSRNNRNGASITLDDAKIQQFLSFVKGFGDFFVKNVGANNDSLLLPTIHIIIFLLLKLPHHIRANRMDFEAVFASVCHGGVKQCLGDASALKCRLNNGVHDSKNRLVHPFVGDVSHPFAVFLGDEVAVS